MASSNSDPNVVLDRLLNNKAHSLLPDELRYLISAFSPTQSESLRSKAFLVLSAFCQGARSKQTSRNPPEAEDTDSLADVFRGTVVYRIAADEEAQFLEGVTFLTALFQVDNRSASSIFLEDGVVETVMDAVELKPSQDVAHSVANLISQAAAHKTSRAGFNSQVKEWLEAQSRQSKDITLRAAAVVALIKLSKGTTFDNLASGGGEAEEDAGVEAELAKVMRGLIIDGPSSSHAALTNAVEGLAYASNDPLTKESLSKDTAFLNGLFSLVPRRRPQQAHQVPSITLIFGIVTIIANICSYRPRLSEEQKNIERLKKMAQSGKKQDSAPSDAERLDEDSYVKARVSRLVQAGVLEPLCTGASISESAGVRLQAGRTLLAIIEDKEHRGKVLQAGGSKVLQVIIKGGLPATEKDAMDEAYLLPIQALAKLAITSSPLHAFGPNEGTVFDAIRPLAFLLLHDNSSLLQKFEAIMALTNIASQSPEAASRVAKFKGLLNKVELLMLEDHVLVQRASTELACNLIGGSDEVFERYATSSSKVQVLLALSDVDDLPTRLAASGALAMLTGEAGCCAAVLELQKEKGRAFSVLVDLVDPAAVEKPEEENTNTVPPAADPGLRHRGIVCIRNLFMSLQDKEESLKKDICMQASQAGLLKALGTVLKSSPGPEVLEPAKEVMQFVVRNSK